MQFVMGAIVGAVAVSVLFLILLVMSIGWILSQISFQKLTEALKKQFEDVSKPSKAEVLDAMTPQEESKLEQPKEWQEFNAKLKDVSSI